MKTRLCTLCGCSYGDIYAFKAGHVCENCVRQLKADGRGHHVHHKD